MIYTQFTRDFQIDSNPFGYVNKFQLDSKLIWPEIGFVTELKENESLCLTL